MIDHSNCTHPRTPAGRRACRASGGQPERRTPEPMKACRKPIQTAVGAWKPPTGTPAPRKRQKRVSGPYSGCVQAELHVGEGRCACGWSNPVGWKPPVAKPSKTR